MCKYMAIALCGVSFFLYVHSENAYQCITSVLNQYTRPFTILVLQSDSDDYAWRISHDYKDSCVVIADSQYLCVYGCNDSFPNNVIVVRKYLNNATLERLSDCEHFDVILALNDIHESNKNWEQRINLIQRLGDNVILGLFSGILSERVQQKKGAQKLGDHFFLLQRDCTIPRRLLRHFWFIGRGRSKHVVTSTFQKKELYSPAKRKKTKWLPGINMVTFMMLYGEYPAYSHIRNKLKAFCNLKHNDFTLWNLVICGSSLIPIDLNDNRWILHKNKCFNLTMSLFDGHVCFNAPNMGATLVRYQKKIASYRIKALIKNIRSFFSDGSMKFFNKW